MMTDPEMKLAWKHKLAEKPRKRPKNKKKRKDQVDHHPQRIRIR
jgi:hypothetical protein